MSLLGRLFSNLRRARVETASAETLAARGMQHLSRNESEAAQRAFEAALRRDAGCAPAHCGLGVLLQQRGARQAALEHLQSATRLAADNRVIVLRSAQAMDEMGFADEAIALLEPAAAAHPSDWKATVRLARLLRARDDFDAATGLMERTIAANPAASVAMEELASLYRDSGRIDEAIELFERITALHPNMSTTHSAVMFHELYRVHDRAALAQSHRVWAKRFAAPGKAPQFPNPLQAERPLRIGYVSADVRRSSASPFIEPLLAARDAARFHVSCYHAWGERDAVSERFAAMADAWHDIAKLSDAELEARVREDAIDILVDLNGHTTGNRLPAFARRLAPVQATYLGYGATTGMTTMDYRISDAVIDPPDEAERYYSERLVYLPGTMWCFVPPAELPAGEARRAALGVVTFGLFNNFAKVSPAALETWADILERLPQSRLVLVGVPSGSTRARVLEPFRRRGVAAERLTFHGRVSYDEYLALHRTVDITFDTFPYNGGATTCDALWMGVPVLTLAGDAVIARSGASLLSDLGLSDWIADSPADYVERALRLAGDRDALAALQDGLHDRMVASALCDAPRFMRGFEGVLRTMWREYCAKAPV
jgi:protein O-GlcNAc transferase